MNRIDNYTTCLETEMNLDTLADKAMLGHAQAQTYIVPPVCQGQIVTVAYATDGELIFQRCFDASDRTEAYYVSDFYALVDGWDPVNKEPELDDGWEWERV